MAMFLTFSTSLRFRGHFGGLVVFILNNYGVDIYRTVNDGCPCFVIRGAHNTAFGNPGVLSKYQMGSVSNQGPVMVNFCVFTLWPPTMLSVIVSSEVPYFSGHLRAFCRHLIVGDDYLSPTGDGFNGDCLGILLEPAVMAYHSFEEMLCFKVPFTSRAGGIKNAGNWCFFRLITSFIALGAGCAMSWRFCSACGHWAWRS